MINMNTKNKSFKEMRNKLYDQGVINNDFMLELKDESLLDIPENPNSWTSEIRTRVNEECKKNFWFFVREVVRVPSDTNILYMDSYEDCPRFKLRSDTLRLFYGYMNNLDIMYTTQDIDSIYEAIAIMLIYEFIVKESIHPNYDNMIPDKVLSCINNIINLNSYSLFLNTMIYRSIVRRDKSTYSINKFIFDILHKKTDPIEDVSEMVNIDCSRIICVDDIMNSKEIDAVMVKSIISYFDKVFEPYNENHNIYDMKFPENRVSNAYLYVSPHTASVMF